jgi:membrane protein
MTVVFAMIYKFMPTARIRWRDVWVGAAVTSALFAVGKFAIGLYLGRASIGSAFGAAGSLVVVMVWVYYSAQIFLLGAEFTRVYAHVHGSRQGEVQAAAPLARPERRRARPVPAVSAGQFKLRARPLLAVGGAAAVGIAAGVLAVFSKRR